MSFSSCRTGKGVTEKPEIPLCVDKWVRNFIVTKAAKEFDKKHFDLDKIMEKARRTFLSPNDEQLAAYNEKRALKGLSPRKKPTSSASKQSQKRSASESTPGTSGTQTKRG